MRGNRTRTNHPRCRSCGASQRMPFVDLGMSPLANSYVKPEQLSREEPLYPLLVFICGSCLLIQVEVFEALDHILQTTRPFLRTRTVACNTQRPMWTGGHDDSP